MRAWDSGAWAGEEMSGDGPVAQLEWSPPLQAESTLALSTIAGVPTTGSASSSMALALSKGNPGAGSRRAGFGGSLSPGPHTARRQGTELETKVADLDQRTTQVVKAESSRVRMHAEQLQRLVESLQQMRMQRDIQRERRQQELKMLENNAARELSNAKKERKDFEAQAEERINRLTAERAEEMRVQRLQYHQEAKEYEARISHDVDKLRGILEEQVTARVECGNRIHDSLQDEFQKLHQSIQNETTHRSGTEHEMTKMVEDVKARMRGEIEQERQKREVVQSKLLGLLEDTCMRIEDIVDPALRCERGCELAG